MTNDELLEVARNNKVALTKEDILEIATHLISNAQESVRTDATQVDMVYLVAYNDAVLDFKDELLKKINKEEVDE